ncbi:hypothetical protein ACOIP5_004000 [Salmonella enterica]
MGIFIGAPATGMGAGESTGGGLSSVKTDGKTLTGDGNATPLALGPAEPFCVGSYISASLTGHLLYSDVPGIIKGTELVSSDFIHTIINGSLLLLSDTNRYHTNEFHPPGTWISCSSIYAAYLGTEDIRAIFRRIA